LKRSEEAQWRRIPVSKWAHSRFPDGRGRRFLGQHFTKALNACQTTPACRRNHI
jgi:hypothetical protein